MKLGACQKYKPEDVPADWVVEPIKRRIWLEYGSGLTEESRVEGKFPVFGSNGQVGTHDAYTVEGPGILVGRKGSVGEVHFSESNFWPIDTVYYVRRTNGDDWRYLFYLLGYLNLGLLNAATGVPGLTRRDAHDILGAFPDPDEQQRIAAAPKLADDAIAKAKAELEATRELKRSLIDRLLTIGKGSSNKILDTKFGPVPSHWEIKSLVEHAGTPTCVKTGPFGAQLPPETFDKSGMQFVNITDIGEGVLDFSEIVYIKDTEAERLSDYQLKSGDLVFSRVASVGRVALIPESLGPFMMSSNCIRLRASDSFDPNFLCLLFLSSPFIKRQVVAMSTGGARPIVTPRFLRRLLIARPPIEEQQEISEIVGMASANETKKVKVVEALQQVKTSLLQNLLTGKIRIPEGTIHG